MSAANWRRAMSTPAASVPAQTPTAAPSQPIPLRRRRRGSLLRWVRASIRPRHVIVLIALLVYPAVATPFFTFQIGGQALTLGLIALSLMFLAGYGGMVSLAQGTIGGVAGYAVAILGTSGSPISLGWTWWVAVLIAIALATLFAALVGWLSVRTAGIYTIMITLAIGVAFYYLTLQNYTVFNGFQGFHTIRPPVLFGIDWRDPVPFYFLALFWALAGYFFVKHVARAPFGVALQGIRDNPRRMNALGYHVNTHRVAAYALAGVMAGIGGVLLVWYNSLMTPGTINTQALIGILIIAVLGGLRHPIGPFIGALVYVLLQNFAIDLVARERFNLVIGGVFLAIVLFSPDGLLGLWVRARAKLGRGARAG